MCELAIFASKSSRRKFSLRQVPRIQTGLNFWDLFLKNRVNCLWDKSLQPVPSLQGSSCKDWSQGLVPSCVLALRKKETLFQSEASCSCMPIMTLFYCGCRRSGNGQEKKFHGQGKVREFYFESKNRRFEESQGKLKLFNMGDFIPLRDVRNNWMKHLGSL